MQTLPTLWILASLATGSQASAYLEADYDPQEYLDVLANIFDDLEEGEDSPPPHQEVPLQDDDETGGSVVPLQGNFEEEAVGPARPRRARKVPANLRDAASDDDESLPETTAESTTEEDFVPNKILRKSRTTWPVGIPEADIPVVWPGGALGLQMTQRAVEMVLAHPEWSLSQFMSAYPVGPSRAYWNRVAHILAFRRIDVRLADEIINDYNGNGSNQSITHIANRIAHSLRRTGAIPVPECQVAMFRGFCLTTNCRGTTGRIPLDNGRTVEVYWIPGNIFAQMVAERGVGFFALRRWQTSPHH